uniref:Uncharacterized protein n=1 Tax=Lepeophtheirus salmonis TaxID=72036 RepID=A0A0K2U5E4_LEPSM
MYFANSSRSRKSPGSSYYLRLLIRIPQRFIWSCVCF